MSRGGCVEVLEDVVASDYCLADARLISRVNDEAQGLGGDASSCEGRGRWLLNGQLRGSSNKRLALNLCQVAQGSGLSGTKPRENIVDLRSTIRRCQILVVSGAQGLHTRALWPEYATNSMNIHKSISLEDWQTTELSMVAVAWQTSNAHDHAQTGRTEAYP